MSKRWSSVGFVHVYLALKRWVGLYHESSKILAKATSI
jgi:hypothetical protein